MYILFGAGQVGLSRCQTGWQARSQPVFSGKPGMISRDHFVCPEPSFSEMKEIG